MALELFIGQGRARPRLFLVLLLLFLILGTWLASAVTGADYVRGSGTADVPDDRISSAPTAFSAQDDRCLLVAVVVGGEPQAFLLWRLRPALAAMSVTAYDPNLWLPDGAGGTATLADRFGEGGRGGCEAVCDTLTKARRGTPTHYLVVTETTLRALMNRLGDTITLSLPEGLEAVAAEQLVAFLSIPADDYPTGRAAFVRMRGDVWAALCDRFFAAARADHLTEDFAALANAAETDLTISHVVQYRDALTALATQNAGQAFTVTVLTNDS